MVTAAEVQTELDAFSQQTLDTLALYTVRIDAAQADADSAQVSANSALTQILQTGVTATNYTDAEVEELRLSLTTLLNTFAGSMNQSIADEVAAQVALFQPSFDADLTTATANAQAIADGLALDLTDFDNVSGQLLNTDLPTLQALIDEVKVAQLETQSDLDIALADMGYASVGAGLDGVIQQAVELSQPLGHTELKAPVGLWTTTSDAVLVSSKVAPLPAAFHTDDPVLGDAYEFPSGATSIGPVSPLIYDSARVYRMMLRMRVVSDGTLGGCAVAFGATAWHPGDTYETAAQTYTVADGEIALYAYATGSAEMLDRLAGKLPLDLTAATTATKLFPFVRQNSGGVTDGILRLSTLEIIDVTDAFEARAAVLDEIDSAPPANPTGVTVTSENVDGVRYKITATWDLPGTDDVAVYDVAVAQDGGNEVVFGVATNRWSAEAAPGSVYTVRVRARDRFSNASAYTAITQHTVAGTAVIQNDNIGQLTADKITVAGATKLSDWRTGGDLTKINGGAISANTIAANKLSIGARNLSVTGLEFEYNSPALNSVSWTAGSIVYEDNSGTPVTQAIAAGNAAWTAGLLYLCWDQGAGTLVTTTVTATAYTANRVILATYGGGTELQANYGRTIIDGGTIKTGSITADRITVPSLDALSANLGTIVVGSANIGAAAVTAAKIANAAITSAKIGDATITSAKIASEIKSTNYLAGSSGWSIKKSGDAEFNSLVVREQQLAQGSTALGGGQSNDSDLTCYYASTTTLAQETLALTGGGVLVIASCRYDAASNSEFYIARGSTKLITQYLGEGFGDRQNVCLVAFDPNPPSGSQTYYFKVFGNGSSGFFSCAGRSIAAMQFKQS